MTYSAKETGFFRGSADYNKVFLEKNRFLSTDA